MKLPPLLLAGLLTIGCDSESPVEPPDTFIGDFLREQGVTQFKSLRVLVEIPAHSVVVFEATFGELDCPSGCFPYGGYGLQAGQRIGWLGPRVDKYPGPTMFDFLETDEYLFSAELMALLEVHPELSRTFIDIMAADLSTSEVGLQHLVGLVQQAGYPQHAWHLLQHPRARSSRIVLEAIASLSNTQTSNFAVAREEAGRLLALLPSAFALVF